MLQALGRFAKLWLNVWGCVALFAAMALGDPPAASTPTTPTTISHLPNGTFWH